MNGLLEQLASRSLDNVPLAIRPRQLSRFESIAPAQHELGEDALIENLDPAATPDVARQDGPVHRLERPVESFEHSRFNHRVASDLAASPTTELRPSAQRQATDAAPRVPTITSHAAGDDRSATLSQRLDQIDLQLQRFAHHDDASGQSTEPAPSPAVEMVESTLHEETHHHQHQTIHHDHSQIIQQADEPPVIVSQPESRVAREPTAPNIVVQDHTTGQRQMEEPNAARHVVHPRIEAKHQSPPPQVAVQPVVPALPAEPSRRAAQPGSVPQIVVERNASNEPSHHTVTVTIGRIEVRAPQKPAAPSINRSKQPTARIMSLDDYMRRRAGGAG